MLSWSLLLAFPPSISIEDPSPVWVFFADKSLPTTAIDDALVARAAEIAPRALARRARVRGDLGVDERDLAIAPAYLSAIRVLGLVVRNESRWLNAVSVDATPAMVSRLLAVPGVTAIRPVAHATRVAPPPGPLPGGPRPPDPLYGVAFDQLAMMGVPDLHACGLTGAGVVVGVLDSGFVLDHVAFAQLDVIAAHDFINDDDIVSDEPGDPANQHGHGSAVLSLLAGRHEGTFMGAAPDVSVLLAKTEDIGQEIEIEEDYYVAGLEWIESMGADMSTSSLGYFQWYTADQLDGQTAVTTMAANVALDNGLVMFSAMGNTGPTPTTLNAPADADRLVAVGAVQPDGVIADFSSRGPTADGRTKPDVCGSGSPVWMADIATPDQYTQAYGTSLATPLVAGVGALLLQAYPDLDGAQMAELLRSTATQAATPDNDDGWGIVQGLAAAGLYCSCVDADDDAAYDQACGGDDCDDAEAAVHPAATEQCNGIDDDCDLVTPADEADADGDGVRVCAGDCDDDDAAAGPDAAEDCGNGVDDDCDAAIDLEDDDCAEPTTGGETTGVASTGADTGTGGGTVGVTTAATTTAPDPGESSGGSSEGGAATDDGSGCGCRSTTVPSGAWLLVLIAFVSARRREPAHGLVAGGHGAAVTRDAGVGE